ncbi:MAG: L,D-transpeptidase family protein [Thermoleophilia bacterium]|nr:L,D-transpeptidase family protein [Gaiellaceae bacterium]MDW8337840.1 L,D-transpeptidase family protein [Thermoleophilia bacterium]
MRTLLVTLVLAAAGTLAVDLRPGGAPRAEATLPAVRPPASLAAQAERTVDVALVRDGRLVRVRRELPRGAQPALHALRELARGPTIEERRRGLRTALAPGLRPRFVRVEGDVFLVRVSATLVGPASGATLERRLAQIGATLSWLETSQTHAAIAIGGRLVTTLRLGSRPGMPRLQEGEEGYPYSVRGVQLRLATIGFLDPSDVTGTLDYRTSQALLAFQGWEGLAKTGTVTGRTQVALFKATQPQPRSRGRGRRLEIHRGPGVLLAVEGSEVVRAVHTSTGAGGSTPAGEFRVYRKERMSWSVPFQVWMPYAAYFRGGIATHEYPIVPPYPASHGCVRLPAGEAERIYRFVDIGTPVIVF